MDTENVEAEECREIKVQKVQHLIDKDLRKHSGIRTNRSRERNDGGQLFKIRTNRSRDGSGSVKKRCKSNASTDLSTPNKDEDYTLTLYTEIHKNLVAEDSTKTSPLEKHMVTKDYRTKMVDWMVEVTTSFKCSIRTYFLAVAIFDTYMRKKQGVTVLENSHVHAIGVGAMYLASKYEDIYPLHSKVVAEKISHNAFTQKQILAKEEEFLKLFEFEMDFITPYDIHQTYFHIVRKKLKTKGDKREDSCLSKIEELSLLLVRMSI